MMITRSSVLLVGIGCFHDLRRASAKFRAACQNPLEFFERVPDTNAVTRFQFEFTNSLLVISTALFENGEGLLDFTRGFKIPQCQNRISKVAEVNRCFGCSDQAVLSQN